MGVHYCNPLVANSRIFDSCSERQLYFRMKGFRSVAVIAMNVDSTMCALCQLMLQEQPAQAGAARARDDQPARGGGAEA